MQIHTYMYIYYSVAIAVGGQLGAVGVPVGVQLGVGLHRARLAEQLGLLHWRLSCNAGEIELRSGRRENSVKHSNQFKQIFILVAPKTSVRWAPSQCSRARCSRWQLVAGIES